MNYLAHAPVASWFDFCALFVAVFLLLRCFLNKPTNHLPPGPRPLPVIGNLLQIGSKSCVTLNEMRKRYGDVFSIYLGDRLAVVVSGQNAVRQCLNYQSALYSARPEFPTSKFILKGKSFSFGYMDQTTHKKYRHIAIGAIHEMARVKSRDMTDDNELNEHPNNETVRGNSGNEEIPFVESFVIDEFLKLGDKLSSVYDREGQSDAKASHASNFITSEILSTVCILNSALLFGKRYERGDPGLEQLVELVLGLQGMDGRVAIFNFMPWIEKIWSQGLERFIQLNNTMENMIKAHAARCKSTYSGTNGAASRSVMDYLVKVSKKNEVDFDDEERLMLSAGDLLGAGTDTMGVAYSWLIVYIATFRSAQEKMRKEIATFEEEHRRLPKYSERMCLPFTMCFITEVLRHSSFVPFAVPHAPIADATLDGFTIPRGTVMLISLWSINRDDKLWEEPDKFRPERFLQPSGRFHQDLAKEVNSFGYGKRRCAGEVVARLQMFLFTVTLINHFEFRRSKGSGNLPDTVHSLSIKPRMIDVVTRRLDDLS